MNNLGSYLKTMQSTRHRRCRSPFTSEVALQPPDRAGFLIRFVVPKVLPIARAVGVCAMRGEGVIGEALWGSPHGVGEVVDAGDGPDPVPRHGHRIGLRGLEVMADAIVDRLPDVAAELGRGIGVEQADRIAGAECGMEFGQQCAIPA